MVTCPFYLERRVVWLEASTRTSFLSLYIYIFVLFYFVAPSPSFSTTVSRGNSLLPLDSHHSYESFVAPFAPVNGKIWKMAHTNNKTKPQFNRSKHTTTNNNTTRKDPSWALRWIGGSLTPFSVSVACGGFASLARSILHWIGSGDVPAKRMKNRLQTHKHKTNFMKIKRTAFGRALDARSFFRCGNGHFFSSTHPFSLSLSLSRFLHYPNIAAAALLKRRCAKRPSHQNAEASHSTHSSAHSSSRNTFDLFLFPFFFLNPVVFFAQLLVLFCKEATQLLVQQAKQQSTEQRTPLPLSPYIQLDIRHIVIYIFISLFYFEKQKEKEETCHCLEELQDSLLKPLPPSAFPTPQSLVMGIPPIEPTADPGTGRPRHGSQGQVPFKMEGWSFGLCSPMEDNMGPAVEETASRGRITSSPASRHLPPLSPTRSPTRHIPSVACTFMANMSLSTSSGSQGISGSPSMGPSPPLTAPFIGLSFPEFDGSLSTSFPKMRSPLPEATAQTGPMPPPPLVGTGGATTAPFIGRRPPTESSMTSRTLQPISALNTLSPQESSIGLGGAHATYPCTTLNSFSPPCSPRCHTPPPQQQQLGTVLDSSSAIGDESSACASRVRPHTPPRGRDGAGPPRRSLVPQLGSSISQRDVSFELPTQRSASPLMRSVSISLREIQNECRSSRQSARPPSEPPSRLPVGYLESLEVPPPKGILQRTDRRERRRGRRLAQRRAVAVEDEPVVEVGPSEWASLIVSQQDLDWSDPTLQDTLYIDIRLYLHTNIYIYIYIYNLLGKKERMFPAVCGSSPTNRKGSSKEVAHRIRYRVRGVVPISFLLIAYIMLNSGHLVTRKTSSPPGASLYLYLYLPSGVRRLTPSPEAVLVQEYLHSETVSHIPFPFFFPPLLITLHEIFNFRSAVINSLTPVRLHVYAYVSEMGIGVCVATAFFLFVVVKFEHNSSILIRFLFGLFIQVVIFDWLDSLDYWS
eukprot:gene9439-6622_t